MLNALDQWTQPGFDGPALHWSRATLKPPYTPPSPATLPTQSSAGKIVAAEPHPWSRAIPMSHTLVVQRRRKDGGWDFGSIVKPGEAVRYSIAVGDGDKPASRVNLYLYPTGSGIAESVWKALDVGVNLAGNAWVDATAPSVGNYTLQATMGTISFLLPVPPFWPKHNAFATLEVSDAAPDPTEPPPGGDGLLPDITGLLKAGTVLALVVGGVMVVKSLRG